MNINESADFIKTYVLHLRNNVKLKLLEENRKNVIEWLSLWTVELLIFIVAEH